MGFENHRLGPGTILIVNRKDQREVIHRRLRLLCGDDWTNECVVVDAM